MEYPGKIAEVKSQCCVSSITDGVYTKLPLLSIDADQTFAMEVCIFETSNRYSIGEVTGLLSTLPIQQSALKSI